MADSKLSHDLGPPFISQGSAEPSRSQESQLASSDDSDSGSQHEFSEDGSLDEHSQDNLDQDGFQHGMDPRGFWGPTVVKPLTPQALAIFKAAQDQAGVVYISRIPPGMRPAKVRHLMTQYGDVGKVYLQQEDVKRAYLRKKYTATKKPHFTEGWVEFRDKRVARSVAGMLNATPIGGKKGSRWRDDVWTMKYLPKFKWHMLTEQIAHEAAVHDAKLRIELSQSRKEQREYLKNVELARVLDKRAERKRLKGEEMPGPKRKSAEMAEESEPKRKKKRERSVDREQQLDSVLTSVF